MCGFYGNLQKKVIVSKIKLMTNGSGGMIVAKKKKVKKTNDERLLDQNHVAYTDLALDWLNDHETAKKQCIDLGIAPEHVLKTIVLNANHDSKDYLVVCLPIEEEIDLKMVAHELNKKQVHLADNKQLINITGYVHGANTPIGIKLRCNFPIYFDQKLQGATKIIVSAGKVGRSVLVELADLVELVDGKFIGVN